MPTGYTADVENGKIVMAWAKKNNIEELDVKIWW